MTILYSDASRALLLTKYQQWDCDNKIYNTLREILLNKYVKDKTDIIDIPTGLEFIAAVRPRSFVWNMRDGGIVGLQAFGFIAQELLEAQTIVGITVPKLVTTTNPDKYEVAPAALLPIMVKAIQELNAKFETYVATHP